MNNIEILERYIKNVWKPKPIHNVIPDWATIGKVEVQAIENLIHENKELKESFKNCFEECTSLRKNFHEQMELYNKEKQYAMGLYYDNQGLQQDLDKEKEKNNKYLDYQCKKCSNNKICKENQWCVTMDRIPCICDNFQDTKFVSKDKIKEKIEELKKEKDKYFEKQVIQGRIDLLQELLKGE